MVLLETLALWDRPAPREPLVWMALLVETANLVLLAHRGETEQTEMLVPLAHRGEMAPLAHRGETVRLARKDQPEPMAHQRSSARNP
jgi:hypothetical protein